MLTHLFLKPPAERISYWWPTLHIWFVLPTVPTYSTTGSMLSQLLSLLEVPVFVSYGQTMLRSLLVIHQCQLSYSWMSTCILLVRLDWNWILSLYLYLCSLCSDECIIFWSLAWTGIALHMCRSWIIWRLRWLWSKCFLVVQSALIKRTAASALLIWLVC